MSAYVARKGWEQLSDAYRKRLQRGGITQTDYERGVSLGKARGHETPTGIGERVWERLKRLARRVAWPAGFDVDDSLENELGKGATPAELETALRDKEYMQQAYKGGDRDRARGRWLRRNPMYAKEIYWYHTFK